MPDLVIGYRSDNVEAVATDLRSVGDAATAMGANVDAGSRQADAAVGRLDGAADAADNLGSSSSQAAGGLGDLGGALSLMPGPLGAVGSGMEAVAPAIMGVTGAADLANLALASNVVQSTKARVAAIRHAVASRVSAAATRTWAAGQWVLNAAMSANPIGLVVIAVAALIAGLVLAYNKSETFRGIVQSVGRVGREAIGWVVDKVSDLVDWVDDKLPGGLRTAKSVAVGVFEAMTTPIRTVIGWVEDLVGAVQDLVGWIQDIDFPDIPDIPGFRLGPAGEGTVLPGGWRVTDAAGGGDTVNIHLPALASLTPDAIRQLIRALDDYFRGKGKKIQLVSA